MSNHKLARGVAHNVCAKFAASAEHIAFLAVQAGLERLDVDLLAARFEPDWLNEDRNVNLVLMCREYLLWALESLPRFQLQSATLQVAYQPADALAGQPLSAVYTTVLKDAQGKALSYCLTQKPQLLCA